MKDIFFHFIIPDFYPVVGGAELSMKRLSTLLTNNYENSFSNIYVLDTPCPSEPHFVDNKVKVIYLTKHKDVLIEPVNEELKYASKEYPDIQLVEKKDIRFLYRFDFVLMQQFIDKSIKENPTHKHLIISFNLTNSGFIGQLLSDYFKIKHISSVRGADFTADFFNPIYSNAFDYVALNADFIVTTSIEQEKLFEIRFKNLENIRTIYNSIINLEHYKCWRSNNNKKIKIVTDCGFSFKKGTHILLKAISQLWDNGCEFEFHIAGSIRRQNRFWDKLINEFSQKYSTNFVWHNYLEDTKEFILGGDLYCSATITEGCSNARIFAFSVGIPIVTTNIAEMPDLAINDKNVFLVPIGDVHEFARKIDYVIRNKNSFGIDEIEFKKRKDFFSSKQEFENWDKIIKGILSNE